MNHDKFYSKAFFYDIAFRFKDVQVENKTLVDAYQEINQKLPTSFLDIAAGPAAGAHVTVFDISEKQLEQDSYVAKRDNLTIKIIQGDMSDLSCVPDKSFDYIIHPISNLYVSDLMPVWNECYRVLRPQGILLASFYNPILFVFARDTELEGKGLLKPQYSLPYSDIQDLAQDIIDKKMENNEAVIFGHTLSSQINGQMEAGFLLSGFYEDDHPSPRFLIEKYIKTMIATRAIRF